MFFKKIASYVVVYIIRIMNTLVPKSRKLVLFSSSDGYSGNAKAMYLYLLQNFPYYATVWVLHQKEEVIRLRKTGIKSYYSFSLPGMAALLRAGFIAATHLEFSRYKAFFGQKYINLWHGMLIKKIGYMDPGEKELWNLRLNWKNIDILCVPYEFYGTVISSQTGINYRNCRVTGIPRNDFIFSSDGKRNLENLFSGISDYKKVILYCPTFRNVCRRTIKRKDSAYSTSYFIDKYFNSELDRFFEDNKICCIIKLHPFEEESAGTDISGKCIRTLTGNMLRHKNLSLEEILNGIDLLITDYSSVYIDYLLLNRPVLFIADDIADYMQKRGIIFNDYGFVACGPAISSVDKFKEEMTRLLYEPGYFEKERQEKINLFHSIKSGFCCALFNEMTG